MSVPGEDLGDGGDDDAQNCIELFKPFALFFPYCMPASSDYYYYYYFLAYGTSIGTGVVQSFRLHYRLDGSGFEFW